MSHQFKPFAQITDLDNVIHRLYAEDSPAPEDFHRAWDWNVDDTVNTKNENWLKEVPISLSPTSEILALAKGRNLTILKAKWNSNESNESKVKYSLSWDGDVTEEYSERVTSVLCLPIAGQGKLSTHCGADWTAIAVGFTSGAVRFYTEKGGILLSEILHDGPVISLKVQSYQPAHCSTSLPLVDELHVAYDRIVCKVQGFALCNILKACRNQLARIQANCKERMEAPSLDLVKWSLPEQDAILDVCVLGSTTTSMFDHLVTASVHGGFYTAYRTGPPEISTVLSAGVSPYFAWHSIVEGTAGPVLSDVAKAVASKLKSAIGNAVPNWLVGSRKMSEDKTKEKLSIEPAEAMACRYGLCDKLRKGERVYLSPQKNLSAVCDALGRILLIDNISGFAIRMWKGYRDAQCAFISVDEDENVTLCKKSLYLVIYIPKKSIIEVWALQQGPKLVTFPASKNGRLLYIKYGLMGVNSVSMKASNSSHHPCVFIDNQGELSEIIIPFHAILNNENNIQSKDAHILKQLKRVLVSKRELNTKHFLDLCNQLMSNDYRLLVLEAAASSKFIKPELMLSILALFRDYAVSVSTEPDEENSIDRVFCIVYNNLKKIVNFFVVTFQFLEAPPDYNSVVPDSPSADDKELAKLLRLSESDLSKLFSFINFGSNSCKMSVKFKHNEDRFSMFLASFLNTYKNEPPLLCSPETSLENLSVIGEVLCQCVLYGAYTIEDWKAQAAGSGIDPRSLMQASVSYWLKKPLGKNIYSELILFMQILQAITSLVSIKDTFSWWDCVRACIVASQNLNNALTMTIIARAVYLSTEEQVSSEDGDWESISQESCLWSQLMSQVEAAAVLQTVLCLKPPKKFESNAIEYRKMDLSLQRLLSEGPGFVSESVAKWVSYFDLPPEWLIKSCALHLPTEETGTPLVIEESEEAKAATENEEKALEHLAMLRNYFPYCLSTETLLANVTWEYLLLWVKEPNQTSLLFKALTYLNAITNINFKLGICTMIWNVHLKVPFENTVKLLHKIGKLPKDRLCQQHLNMADSNVKYFLKSLKDFFHTFLETCGLSLDEGAPKPVLREGFWTSTAKPSLSEIAMTQGRPNPKILNIQNQCTTILWFLASFPIRLFRPITNLFHSVEEAQLWIDIKSKLSPSKLSPDPKLEETRIGFLVKVINAAIERISLPENSENVDIQESVNWISACFTLAHEWGLPSDPLRIQQVTALYKQHCDTLAREVVAAVNDRESLGVMLLGITGDRLNTILKSSSIDLKERFANLSPSLTSWIQEQKESKLVANINDTAQLAFLVVNLLPETNSDYKFAVLLAEAIQPLAVPL